ncbi:ZIP family metal transporter [Candidatus Uhrbacteria bacterium]|nr:ZIP family metal transporter [Candidatus Uhrbacteria bacterium]
MAINLSELILYGLIGGLFSLLGGLLVLWRSDALKHFMTPLVSFAAGAFLAASFLDLMPEALEGGKDTHRIFVAFLTGVTLFFIFERFYMKYVHRSHAHAHADHEEHTESLPWLVIIGDTIHNFLDGVVIALAYIANPLLGLPTAIAIAAHELPQEIGDFAILLDRGWSKLKVIAINIFSSLVNLVGIGVAVLAAPLFEGRLPYLISVASGMFTYIALSDLVPELHHRAGHKHFFRIILSFVTGLVLAGYLISVTHGLE